MNNGGIGITGLLTIIITNYIEMVVGFFTLISINWHYIGHLLISGV